MPIDSVLDRGWSSPQQLDWYRWCRRSDPRPGGGLHLGVPSIFGENGQKTRKLGEKEGRKTQIKPKTGRICDFWDKIGARAENN